MPDIAPAEATESSQSQTVRAILTAIIAPLFVGAAVYGVFHLGYTILRGGSGIGAAFLGTYLGTLAAKTLFPKLYPQAAGIIGLTIWGPAILMIILGGVINLALRDLGVTSHLTIFYGISPLLIIASLFASYRLGRHDHGIFGPIRWGVAAMLTLVYVGGFIADVQLNPRVEERFTADSIDETMVTDF